MSVSQPSTSTGFFSEKVSNIGIDLIYQLSIKCLSIESIRVSLAAASVERATVSILVIIVAPRSALTVLPEEYRQALRTKSSSSESAFLLIIAWKSLSNHSIAGCVCISGSVSIISLLRESDHASTPTEARSALSSALYSASYSSSAELISFRRYLVNRL